MISLTILIPSLVALFVLGVAIGYIYSKNSEEPSSARARTIIAIIVTIVWVMAMVADIVLTGYVVSPLVHAIMGAVVGYFFAEKGLNVNIGG